MWEKYYGISLALTFKYTSKPIVVSILDEMFLRFRGKPTMFF